MDKVKNFKKIMDESKTDKIIIFTNHYKISGQIYECEEFHKESFLNLTNATLCTIEKSNNNSNYDWLHINFDKIIAFSFIKGGGKGVKG